MSKIRRILLPLLLGLAALAAAAAATLGTIWCAQEDKPRRGIAFAVMMVTVAAVHLVLRPEKLAWLLVVEGLYLTLFLFARSLHSPCR